MKLAGKCKVFWEKSGHFIHHKSNVDCPAFNLGLHGGKMVTDCQSYGISVYILCKKGLRLEWC